MYICIYIIYVYTSRPSSEKTSPIEINERLQRYMIAARHSTNTKFVAQITLGASVVSNI